MVERELEERGIYHHDLAVTAKDHQAALCQFLQRGINVFDTLIEVLGEVGDGGSAPRRREGLVDVDPNVLELLWQLCHRRFLSLRTTMFDKTYHLIDIIDMIPNISSYQTASELQSEWMNSPNGHCFQGR